MHYEIVLDLRLPDGITLPIWAMLPIWAIGPDCLLPLTVNMLQIVWMSDSDVPGHLLLVVLDVTLEYPTHSTNLRIRVRVRVRVKVRVRVSNG